MPNGNKVTRKLTAILSADVKGYSLLMADDEVHTIQTLKTYRQVMADLIQAHSGRVVDNPGDNLLAEFSSAVDAVECAVEVQKNLTKENAKFVEDMKLQFRIGVNIGDVVHDGDRIYGSGVNVAARIEGIADPGGICISRNTYDHVKGKLDFGFEYLGEHEVKNVAEPARVYRVLMDAETQKPLIEEQLELPDKPSIAVLPFDNMSGDPEQEYFSDGITEDIITALARSQWMFVIARNSSFTYRGKAVDVKIISRELGVRYILEGSVRKAVNRIRVTAQLIDGLNGEHVWAEKYDGQLEDIFDLQDQITQKVVASTHTQIQLSLGKADAKVRREKLHTWDLIAKAWKYIYDFSEDSLNRAEKLMREALDLDTNSGMANCMLGSALIHKVIMGYVPGKARQTIDESYKYTQKAVSIDEQNEYSHWTLGVIYSVIKKHDFALAELQRAIDINPNLSLAYGVFGSIYAHSGKPDEAIKYSKIAIKINPRDLSILFRYDDIAISHLVSGRYSQAIKWSYKSIQRKPSYQFSHAILISSLGLQGKVQEAKEAIESYYEMSDGKRFPSFKKIPFKNLEDLNKFHEGLRKAGLHD